MLNIILGIIGVMMLVVPAEASTGSTALRCRWCGASCGNYPVNTRCEDVLPADGGLCVEENGVCVVKQGDVEVTPSAYVTCKRCATGVSHGSGNANCDTEVGLMDFGIWKSEYQSGVGRDADFNCDGEVGLMDFGLWKAGYQSGLTVTPTTIMSVTTPTAGVSATPTMTIMSLPFSDNFSTYLPWTPVRDANGLTGRIEEEYFLKDTQSNKFLAGLAPVDLTVNTENGFSVEAEMRLMQANDSKIGIVFDWDSNKKFYLAHIKPSTGEYFVYKRIESSNSYIYLKNGSSQLIKSGVNKNTLKIVRKPSLIEIWVKDTSGNFQMIDSFADVREYKGRWSGVQLSIYSNPTSEARFDNVEIKSLMIPTGIMSVTTPTAFPTDEVCRADGAQCRGNSDCCSGDCNNGQCGESVSTQCNPPQTDPHYVELNGSCQEVNSCGFNSQACL